jgi:hypothetical protein
MSSRMQVYDFSRAAMLSRSRSPKPRRATPSQAQGTLFARLAARLKPHTRSAAILGSPRRTWKANRNSIEEPKDCQGEIQQGNKIGGGKIKSSEVMQGPFVSASSSRLTLARPANAASLAGPLRAISAWAPGSPPTG